MSGQNLLSPKNVKDENLTLEDKNLIKISRSKLGYFSAITLPMILANCTFLAYACVCVCVCVSSCWATPDELI